MNRQKKRQQEEANDQYGSLLKQQVADSQQRKRDAVNQNNDFAALEDARVRTFDDTQMIMRSACWLTDPLHC